MSALPFSDFSSNFFFLLSIHLVALYRTRASGRQPPPTSPFLFFFFFFPYIAKDTRAILELQESEQHPGQATQGYEQI